MQVLFNLATWSNYSITSYVMIPVFHFLEKVKKRQLKMVNVNYQGFLNSCTGWGDDRKIYWGRFFTGWREPDEKRFWRFEPFSKLRTTFHECWTSIKIKINMTCVSKEYEIKTKMEQEQWLQLKILFIAYNSL